MFPSSVACELLADLQARSGVLAGSVGETEWEEGRFVMKRLAAKAKKGKRGTKKSGNRGRGKRAGAGGGSLEDVLRAGWAAAEGSFEAMLASSGAGASEEPGEKPAEPVETAAASEQELVEEAASEERFMDGSGPLLAPLSELEPSLPSLSLKDLAELLRCLKRLSFKHQPTLSHIESSAASLVKQAVDNDSDRFYLSGMLSSLASLRAPSPELFGAVSDNSEALFPVGTPPQRVSTALWSAARLGEEMPGLVGILATEGGAEL
ncbi:hypothetical protein TeGR_g13003 [Tetraparma gracilis]|uniref:Uncharacterized protein n=1 Tax=Tetraparma gracilis TaxID=2962635 RepID=A0ABQ6N8U7_9STRA|nr:hypothetical protein TeGR_g13003 [Tetraparma gracilis]